MSGNDVALDTSAAIKLLNDASLAEEFLLTTGRVYLSSIAAGELLYGAMNSTRRASNLPRFREFIEHCAILTISLRTADLYANVRMDLKLRGKPIPETDIWIAASAMEHQLTRATTDAHFASVEGLHLFPFPWAPN